MSAPRTPEQWRAWREAVRAPWIEAARSVALLDAFANPAIGRGVTLRREGREWVGPCPACGGRDRFAIHTAKGTFNCRRCGGGGDAIALARLGAGVDFLGAVALLTGRPDPAAGAADPRPVAAPAPDDAGRSRAARAAEEERRRDEERRADRAAIRRARGLWEEGSRFSGSPAQAYLAHRRVWPAHLPAPRLRFAMLPWWHDGRSLGLLPVMIGCFVRPRADGEAEPVGVHLTALDPAFLSPGAAPATAKGKAVIVDPRTGDSVTPKKIRGRVRGAAIRLIGPPAPRLLIRAEGIETALAFTAALIAGGRFGADVGVWAVGSQDALRFIGGDDGLVLPDATREVLDLADADCDPARMRHALDAAAQRVRASGRLSASLWPAPGQDWPATLGAA